MYYDQYQSYFQANSDPALFASEVMQDQEWERLASFYSDTSANIRNTVCTWCQRMDYEGSRIYDEYPDRQMLERAVRDIRDEVQKTLEGEREEQREMTGEQAEFPDLTAQARREDFLDDLIQVLLLQEIARRRCRNHRCKNRMNHGNRKTITEI